MPRSILCVLILALGLRAQDQPPQLIVGAKILAPSGTSWLDGHVVLIQGPRIAAVGPAKEVAVPADAVILEASGLYLIPGLIDLHTHLLLHPYDQVSWNDQVLHDSLEFRVLRAAPAAKSTLEAGFTSIRELGTEGAAFADVGLQRAIRQGVIPGPRVFTATRAIVATGCYGPAGFDPRWRLPKGAEEADGADGVRRAVRRQIAAGADWIKLYGDYRRRPGDPSTPTFSQAELAAAVDEANSAGLPVAVHAVTDEAIRRAVRAGVRTIEHGTGASTATLLAMRDAGVYLVPTLAAGEALARYSGWKPGEKEPARLVAGRALIERALAVHAAIACGSDAGVFTHGENARELELLREYGLSGAETLAAATTVAAQVLRRDDLGVLRPQARADIVLVAGDPLDDVKAFRRPVAVWKNGQLVLDHRGGATAKEAVAFCKQFLGHYSEGRWDRVRSAFQPGALIAASYGDGRQEIVPAEDFLKRVTKAVEEKGLAIKEWISAEPRVLVDGAIITVWAPFTVVAGESTAQGTDVFQLIRTTEGFRIVALTYTNRTVPKAH